MEYLLDESGDGPELYAKFVELLVKAVAQHPFAVGIETMNEPPVAPPDMYPSNTTVSRHEIAGNHLGCIFFSRWQRYRC